MDKNIVEFEKYDEEDKYLETAMANFIIGDNDNKPFKYSIRLLDGNTYDMEIPFDEHITEEHSFIEELQEFFHNERQLQMIITDIRNAQIDNIINKSVSMHVDFSEAILKIKLNEEDKVYILTLPIDVDNEPEVSDKNYEEIGDIIEEKISKLIPIPGDIDYKEYDNTYTRKISMSINNIINNFILKIRETIEEMRNELRQGNKEFIRKKYLEQKKKKFWTYRNKMKKDIKKLLKKGMEVKDMRKGYRDFLQKEEMIKEINKQIIKGYTLSEINREMKDFLNKNKDIKKFMFDIKKYNRPNFDPDYVDSKRDIENYDIHQPEYREEEKEVVEYIPAPVEHENINDLVIPREQRRRYEEYGVDKFVYPRKGNAYFINIEKIGIPRNFEKLQELLLGFFTTFHHFKTLSNDFFEILFEMCANPRIILGIKSVEKYKPLISDINNVAGEKLVNDNMTDKRVFDYFVHRLLAQPDNGGILDDLILRIGGCKYVEIINKVRVVEDTKIIEVLTERHNSYDYFVNARRIKMNTIGIKEFLPSFLYNRYKRVLFAISRHVYEAMTDIEKVDNDLGNLMGSMDIDMDKTPEVNLDQMNMEDKDDIDDLDMTKMDLEQNNQGIYNRIVKNRPQDFENKYFNETLHNIGQLPPNFLENGNTDEVIKEIKTVAGQKYWLANGFEDNTMTDIDLFYYILNDPNYIYHILNDAELSKTYRNFLYDINKYFSLPTLERNVYNEEENNNFIGRLRDRNNISNYLQTKNIDFVDMIVDMSLDQYGKVLYAVTQRYPAIDYFINSPAINKHGFYNGYHNLSNRFLYNPNHRSLINISAFIDDSIRKNLKL